MGEEEDDDDDDSDVFDVASRRKGESRKWVGCFLLKCDVAVTTAGLVGLCD